MTGGDAYQPTDRRPIASRQTRWARLAAKALATRGVSPNVISIAGMVACVLAGACFAATDLAASGPLDRLLWLVGALLCQARLVANLLDGMVAIESGRASPVGELYNEVPDRVSDAATFIGLGYAAGGSLGLTLGYLAACLAILTAYVRTQGKAVGAPSDFSGPMAKPHRMFVVTLLSVFMALAPAGWYLPCWPGWIAWNPVDVALLVIVVGSAVTSVRRLVRIARALRSAGG